MNSIIRLQNIIDSETNVATVVSFRPIGGSLVECESNNDCESCLSNELNVERCRFCGNGNCQDFDLACQGRGEVFVDVSMCPKVQTTLSRAVTSMSKVSTSISTQSQLTTLDVSATTTSETLLSTPETANETAEEGESESSSSVGLIVGLVILGLLAVAGAWFAVWFFAIRPKKDNEIDQNGVQMADYSENSNRARYGSFDSSNNDNDKRYAQVEIGTKTNHYEESGI